MNIMITGGLGFVGRYLSMYLLHNGHQVTAVGRRRNPAPMIDHAAFTYLSADTTRPGDWQAQLPDKEVVVNLAGKSIFTFWTAKAKQAIYDSRIITTRNLVDGLAGTGRTILISASAVGYYGDRGEDVLVEVEPAGDDFLANVGKAWEHEALRAQSKGARVVLTRFGIVLGKHGGAMAKMIPAFRLFLGGRLGSGNQWFPWIHIHDLAAACRFLIEDAQIDGPVNFCAPQPVRNRELVAALGRKLNRPALLPAPAFVVKNVLGEFGATLLCSQRVKPAVLEKAGFRFAYPDIGSALEEII